MRTDPRRALVRRVEEVRVGTGVLPLAPARVAHLADVDRVEQGALGPGLLHLLERRKEVRVVARGRGDQQARSGLELQVRQDVVVELRAAAERTCGKQGRGHQQMGTGTGGAGEREGKGGCWVDVGAGRTWAVGERWGLLGRDGRTDSDDGAPFRVERGANQRGKVPKGRGHGGFCKAGGAVGVRAFCQLSLRGRRALDWDWATKCRHWVSDGVWAQHGQRVAPRAPVGRGRWICGEGTTRGGTRGWIGGSCRERTRGGTRGWIGGLCRERTRGGALVDILG